MCYGPAASSAATAPNYNTYGVPWASFGLPNQIHQALLAQSPTNYSTAGATGYPRWSGVNNQYMGLLPYSWGSLFGTPGPSQGAWNPPWQRAMGLGTGTGGVNAAGPPQSVPINSAGGAPSPPPAVPGDQWMQNYLGQQPQTTPTVNPSALTQADRQFALYMANRGGMGGTPTYTALQNALGGAQAANPILTQAPWMSDPYDITGALSGFDPAAYQGQLRNYFNYLGPGSAANNWQSWGVR